MDRLYLDFDGVINRLGVSIESPWPTTRGTEITLTNSGLMSTYPINYSPELIKEICRLLDDGVDIVWLSTWEHNTEKFDKLGLPEMPFCWLSVADWSKKDLFYEAKYRSLEGHLIKHPADRVFWVDDDLKHSDMSNRAAAQRGVQTISPEKHIGLTPDHINQIRGYFNLD